MLVWGLAGAVVLMAGLCMSLLASQGAWKEQAYEARDLVARFHNGEKPHGAVRVFCAKWGLVITQDIIREREKK